jgi:hypothetical protein
MCFPNVVNGLVGEVISIVSSFTTNRSALVLLPRSVPIVVRERVEKEIRRGPAGGMRLIEIFDSVRIEKLAGIVGTVACFLEPDGQVLAV